MNRLSVTLLAILATIACSAQKPNIIYIMADDMGYGELGCYGQKKIKTPNIDRMAREGLRFTQYYTNTLCAPTRCSFITGLCGLHAQVRDNLEYGGFKDEEEFGQLPLAANTITIATELKKAGYTTAVFGKWGLGGPNTTGIPTKQGFDQFYGFLDQKQSHNFYPSHLWRNNKSEWLQPYFSPHQKLDGDSTNPELYKKYSGKIYAPDTITAEAVKFIGKNKKKPFFLYLAYTLPHVALQVPDKDLEQYNGKFQEQPYTGRNGYLPHLRPRSAYAAMISKLDEYVGIILETVRKQGLEKNTLIIFTSDNGATTPGTGGADTDFFESNGSLRGYKGSLYEGGIRVPFIARWPGIIKGGMAHNGIAAVWDLAPTFCELAGVKPSFAGDGFSLLSTLIGTRYPKHEWLYWEVHNFFDGMQAVRWKNWKAVRKGVHKNKDAAFELYDLNNDPKEQNDVAQQHPEVIMEINKIIAQRSRPVIKEWNF